MTSFLRVSLSALLLVALLGQTPALASARNPTTSFFVNSLLDETDTTPNGVCQSASGGCTLRAALMEANTTPGIDTINIPVGVYTLTIAGASEDLALTGDLDVTEAVRINGDPGGLTIIDGGGLDRVFDILATGGQQMEMRDVIIRNGGGAGFAGVRMQSGVNVLIEQTTITANMGSGIRNDALLLILNRVTVAGNSTAGLYNTGDTVNIINSTLSGNSGANGGGLYTESGTISINNTTIANNIAITGGGLYRTGSASVAMKNSIIAGNSADMSPDCSGILSPVLYSLIQNVSGCNIDDTTGNLLGVNPMLGPLQNNGGPTLTHALGLASPALNAGDPSGCKDAQLASLTTDQRGTARPQPLGERCDMGAYEMPVVQFASANFSAEEGAGAGVITATLDGVSALTVTVPYTASNGTAVAGSDYVTTTGILTFPPNALAMTFTVPLLEDLLDEADETVALTLGNPGGAVLDTPITATLAILDNDLPPEFYLAREDYTVDENAGPATITASLSAVSGVTVTVNYSTSNGNALAGSDYTAASGTLTFSPGLTTATFTVPIVDDNFYEPDETLTLQLGGAVNASPGSPTEATLTIINDDAPRLFLPWMGRNTFSCWAGPSEIEPNGSTAQANGPLCFDGRPYTGGDSTPADTLDWDYYTMFWPQAGQFTVQLSGAALGSGLQVQMYYQTIGSGTLVGFKASSPYQIICPPGDGDCTGAAGLYYILVLTPANYSGSGYTLTVTTP